MGRCSIDQSRQDVLLTSKKVLMDRADIGHQSGVISWIYRLITLPANYLCKPSVTFLNQAERYL